MPADQPKHTVIKLLRSNQNRLMCDSHGNAASHLEPTMGTLWQPDTKVAVSRPNLTHWGLVTPFGNIGSGSTLAQVVACCLTAPSHYLNQCWLIIRDVLGIQLRALSLDDVKIPINKTRLKIAVLKWHLGLPGANELTYAQGHRGQWH